MPAFAWLDGWYTASLQAVDEVNPTSTAAASNSWPAAAASTTTISTCWPRCVLRERWLINVADDGEGGLSPLPYRYGSYVFPALEATTSTSTTASTAPRAQAAYPAARRARRCGRQQFTFLQVHARVQWFHGFDADSKLILRGEAGHTFSGSFLDLPPSLRFYAGGDRSVRGYDWHEIGPGRSGRDVYYTGASNVVTASVEYERYFKGPWAPRCSSTAAAFEGKRPTCTPASASACARARRWVQWIDIARGLKSPDSPFTLHFAIGADL